MLIIYRKSIMLMHRPQTPQPGFSSITLLQKFTPHFKILDARLGVTKYNNKRLCNYRHECDRTFRKLALGRHGGTLAVFVKFVIEIK